MTRITRPGLALLTIALLAGASACGGGTTETAATTAPTTALETIPSTTLPPPVTPRQATTTIETTTTTTFSAPKLNGKVSITPNSVPPTYTYETQGAGSTPVLSWDVKLEPGQKVSVHGPAPGTADAELSTVASGSFPLCPGSLVGTSCTLDQSRYVWTVDVKDASGNVVASDTATLKVAK